MESTLVKKKEAEEIRWDALRCPECNSPRLIYDETTGDRICSNCGVVIGDRIIDAGPEWRAFSSEEQDVKSRVGSPTTLRIHDKGLSTQIDPRDRDIYGHRLGPRMQQQVHRLRRWQRRSSMQSSEERNLLQAFNELDRISSQLGIPRTARETSAMIYRKTLDKHLSRGRSIDALVAASIYAAARMRGVPLTLEDVSLRSKVTKKDLGKAYRVLAMELNLKVPPPNPIAYIPRYATELQLSGTCQREAVNLLRKAKENGLTGGKDPKGMAAAALYLAGILVGERRTQREIAEATSVTEVTVRNRYKDLVNKLNLVELAL